MFVVDFDDRHSKTQMSEKSILSTTTLVIQIQGHAKVRVHCVPLRGDAVCTVLAQYRDQARCE